MTQVSSSTRSVKGGKSLSANAFSVVPFMITLSLQPGSKGSFGYFCFMFLSIYFIKLTFLVKKQVVRLLIGPITEVLLTPRQNFGK